jgi:NTE family protein
MRELMVSTSIGPRPLLDQIDAMSGVSGGSFPAAYYGLYREKTFGGFERDFLYDDTNSYIYGIYLLPWNWTWLVEPGSARTTLWTASTIAPCSTAPRSPTCKHAAGR